MLDRFPGMDVAQTFEEVAADEIDVLYHGALFLCGGRRDAAEELLVDVLTDAQSDGVGFGTTDVSRELERRLVEAFLVPARDEVPDPDAMPREGQAAVGRPVALEPSELFAAADSLPASPRAALWLVLLRRWSYADAADALKVDAEGLRRMLGYRDAFVRELMRGQGRRRAAGEAPHE